MENSENQVGMDVGRQKENIPQEVVEAAECAKNACLPAISKLRYEKTFVEFEKWRQSKDVSIITEEIMLAYFYHLSTENNLKPTSLSAYYSMIKSMMKLKFNIDISSYYHLTAFLKTNGAGYKPTKSHLFSVEQIAKFVSEASDGEWLDVKAMCIFGICGGLRCDELAKVKLADIEHHSNMLLVHVDYTKNKDGKSFTISGEFFNVVQRYSALRDPRTKDPRFFVNYQKGKCTVQPIGKNKISGLPFRIASFLSLPEAKRYTGHSFRRTGTTALANTGASMERVQNFGGWKSPKVAQGYIENSLNYKKETGDIIVSSIVNSIGRTNLENRVDDSMNNYTVSQINTILQERVEVSVETSVETAMVPTNRSDETVTKDNSNFLGKGSFNFGTLTSCTFNINLPK